MDGWLEVDAGELDWLLDGCGEQFSGFGPPPYPAGLWILHAMYEVGPDGDETLLRNVDGEDDDDEEPGWPADPGRGWRRLRWRELSERTGEPLVPQYVAPYYRVPSFRAFPSIRQGDGLWERIRFPMWGRMDRESFRSLAAILRRFSRADDVVFAHPCPMQNLEGGLRVFQGTLRDLEALEELDPYYSPANLWAADRSWLLYTDWDLWGTKVYGPPALLAMVEEDEFLESVRLPLTDDLPGESA